MNRLRRVFLCLFLVALAGCSGPEEVERFDEWTEGDGVRFMLKAQSCQLSQTDELFPESVQLCSVMLFIESSEAVAMAAEDQLFTYGDQEVAAYGATISREESAKTTQGPAPGPTEAPPAVSMEINDAAVVHFYGVLPENESPSSFILDPGTGSSYLFDLTR